MTCTKCNQEKQETEFGYKNKARKKLHTQCRTCHSAYRRVHYINNREKYLRKAAKWNSTHKMVYRLLILYAKIRGACIDCGEDDPILLDFDHINDKLFDISSAPKCNIGLDKILIEINKCELRCANCHRRKTAKQAKWYRHRPSDHDLKLLRDKFHCEFDAEFWEKWNTIHRNYH